jgi:large subunit ribosomal protein L6
MEGFSKQLILVGIGRDLAQRQGNNLLLDVGFSHKVNFAIPEGISIEVGRGDIIDKLTHFSITVKGIDKQLVGEVAATIRRIQPPEVYKPGKGIRYADERPRMKVGKTGTA